MPAAADDRPQRDNARTIGMGPNLITYLIPGEHTGGKFSLTEFAAAPPPAPSAPLHIHRDADEALYVLEGTFEFRLDGETIPAPAGAFIHIPRGVRHTIANVGATMGKYLVILAPPGFEQFWAARAQQIEEHGSQVDPALVRALQEKYHLDMGGQVREV